MRFKLSPRQSDPNLVMAGIEINCFSDLAEADIYLDADQSDMFIKAIAPFMLMESNQKTGE